MMLEMRCVLHLAFVFALASAQAVEWRNVDSGHYLGGRRCSEGYLQGKVVLVCRLGAGRDGDAGAAAHAEETWRSFKAKSFVVLGGLCTDRASPAEARALIAKARPTYPVYEDAGLAGSEPAFDAAPYLYVVDETGRIVYRGVDECAATEAVVTAITDMESPRNLAQWRRFLDYELRHLPCRACLRLREFRKRFPSEAKEYENAAKELVAIPDLRKIVNLVEFAKKAKDPPVFGPKDGAKRRKYQKLVNDVVANCEAMKSHPDPRVVQEVKNSLADLRWAQASF